MSKNIHDIDTAAAGAHQPLRGDVLWGAQAIADELNRPVGDIYYLLRLGRIPCGKIGSTWVTTRSRLRAFIERDLEVA